MARYEIELFIVMNSDGDYEVGIDEDSAIEHFDENVGGHPRRMAKITAYMAAPTTAKTDVVIPDDEDDGKVRAEADEAA